MPVTSPYDAPMARLTASVLAGPSSNPTPAPASTMYGHCAPRLSSAAFQAHRANPAVASAAPRITGIRAPRGARQRPADLRRGGEPAEEDEQVETGLVGVEPERELGVDAGEEEHRD